MLSGEIQFTTADALNTIQAVNAGADLVMVCAGVNRFVFSIMARGDIKRISDLKGKKIGLSKSLNTIKNDWWRIQEHMGIENMLMLHEMTMDDVELVEFPYPDAKNGLNRWLPIVKWALAIPHLIVLFFLSIGAFFAVVGAWFAILFTGRYPRGLFDFVLGVLRWWNRVIAYAFALVTDEYPPFRLGA